MTAHTADDGLFQSTPPVKAATLSPHSTALPGAISIHAAREGGDAAGKLILMHDGISIHAAREGGDRLFLCANTCRTGFQSTPPVKAATYAPNGCIIKA